MKKIGIYGGSFDPIHHGHLILAREALETLDLDEVIFVPAAQSPHKTRQEPTDSAVRWEMLTAAIAGEPGFSASRLELDRPPPSYSVETVETLRAANPEAEFYFLIGEDNLPQLHGRGIASTICGVWSSSSCSIAPAKTSPNGYPAVRRKIDISATDDQKTSCAAGNRFVISCRRRSSESSAAKISTKEPSESNPKN